MEEIIILVSKYFFVFYLLFEIVSELNNEQCTECERVNPNDAGSNIYCESCTEAHFIDDVCTRKLLLVLLQHKKSNFYQKSTHNLKYTVHISRFKYAVLHEFI